ncbi:MAG: SxtJ family membrane protein, partial [Rhodospirillaceae bacterium]|nr:SxtJ family membrane protein [Rhodospirillaceae bacterium]
AWMRFGLLASRVTTPVILGAFFFVIISPVALVRRLCGRDSMSRRFERDLESYRVASRPQTKDKLEKPF